MHKKKILITVFLSLILIFSFPLGFADGSKIPATIGKIIWAPPFQLANYLTGGVGIFNLGLIGKLTALGIVFGYYFLLIWFIHFIYKKIKSSRQ